MFLTRQLTVLVTDVQEGPRVIVGVQDLLEELAIHSHALHVIAEDEWETFLCEDWTAVPI